MYLWKRKSPLNLKSHPDLEFGFAFVGGLRSLSALLFYNIYKQSHAFIYKYRRRLIYKSFIHQKLVAHKKHRKQT